MNNEEDNVAFLQRLWDAAVAAHFDEKAPVGNVTREGWHGTKCRGLTLPMRDWSRLDVLRGEPAWIEPRDLDGSHTCNAFEATQWVMEARKRCQTAVRERLRS
jgi:hypothetical protein